MITATQKYLNEIMNYNSHGKLLNLNTLWKHNMDIHIYRPTMCSFDWCWDNVPW